MEKGMTGINVIEELTLIPEDERTKWQSRVLAELQYYKKEQDRPKNEAQFARFIKRGGTFPY